MIDICCVIELHVLEAHTSSSTDDVVDRQYLGQRWVIAASMLYCSWAGVHVLLEIPMVYGAPRGHSFQGCLRIRNLYSGKLILFGLHQLVNLLHILISQLLYGI